MAQRRDLLCHLRAHAVGTVAADGVAAAAAHDRAFLVGSVTGAKQSGNVVTFLDGAHTLQIWPPCSSFHNISQAGLAWVALRLSWGETWS